MKIIFEQFNSLEDFCAIIKQRQPNQVFQGEKLSSNKDDTDFTLTKNYEEAELLAKYGYHKGLENMQAGEAKPTHMEGAPKKVPAIDVTGYAPHIPNAIQGLPKSMIFTPPITRQKNKIISILYSPDAYAMIRTDQIIKAGKNILNVIYTLETQGYRVALNVLIAFCRKGSEVATACVQIKTWQQPSNPLKMAYPLIHPSFLRRHNFRWLETQPELTEMSFRGGYGQTLETIVGEDSQKGTQRRREWLNEQGMLNPGWFYTERVEAENATAEELIALMGIE